VDGGARAEVAADRRFRELGSRDRALATELAYGAIRLRGRLDHELAALVDRPSGQVEPGVRDWLRLGLYQLRETRIPDHAAIHESVEGARATVADRVAGFVNGVLRAATRVADRAGLFPSFEEDPAGHLTSWGSHPEWLVHRWLDRWPRERVRELVELDNRPPDVVLRLLDVGPAEAAARAREMGLRLEALPDWPRSLRLEGGDPTPLLAEVPAVVQDPAASAVVDYVGPDGDGPVLDACAAPGGKAVALASERGGARPFVAADVRVSRLRPTLTAAGRTGVSLSCVAMDARAPALSRASVVLADVPCTGTGTLRRRPDARWRADARRLEAVRPLQREILDGCAELVEPGGLLVYSTCSLEPEENEAQVNAFLSRRRDFRRLPLPSDIPLPDDVVDAEGDLRVLPWTRGTDGSYAARLQRRPT
jgi:16S rRNA (cytosine967-C5)-methyltransferase